MKVIAGSSPSRSSRSMTSARVAPPPGRHRAAKPRPPAPPPGPRPRRAGARGVRHRARRRRVPTPPRRGSASTRPRCSERADRREQVGVDPVSPTNRSKIACPTIMCCHSGTGRCSETMTSVSPRTSPSQSPNSSALLTVADSETTCTSLGQVDDDLLPHRPAEPVGEVVHLVHDHEPEAAQGRRPGVHHVAQHLGGHDDDRRLAVDRGVPGQQARPCRRRAAHEVVRTSGWTAP